MGAITGARGRVRWGYVDAATLKDFTVRRDGSAWRLAAEVVTANPVALEQQPLIFEVAPAGVWSWPVTAIDIQDGQLRATLGPPRG